MTNNKGILIENIYYMLCYAFQVLKQEDYKNIGSESFENIQDLFAAILARGIAQQIKQGLYREYVAQQDDLPVMRGRLDISQTIRLQAQCKKQLACEFDELSEDNTYNRILNTTMYYLVHSDDDMIKPAQKSELKKLMQYFSNIALIEPSAISWSKLHYQRSNRLYEMLINICYFVLHDMLQTTEDGKYKMAAFSDERMAKLYEKFILNYYCKHFSMLHASASYIPWALDEITDAELPSMKSDISLQLNDKILIIDAKYYSHNMQEQYGKKTIHSHNLYQIFTYVKNRRYQFNDKQHIVSGMLMYAKTDEKIQPKGNFVLCGNRFFVETLDLNTDFELIKAQLDGIVESYFGLQSQHIDSRTRKETLQMGF